MDRITDSLTYKDLAGRWRVRRYALAAAAIFALVGGITFWGWRQRGQLLALGMGTPTVVNPAGQQEMGRITPTSASVTVVKTQPAFRTAQPAATPSIGAQSAQSGTPGECPDDPSVWKFLNIAQNDNFKRVEPPCVYDGLSRTVAWNLLRVMGYSAVEAAEIMGFPDLPWRPVPEIVGMTNTQGPMSIALANPSPEEIRQAGHPEFHAWIVDSVGNSGVVHTLRGCYRTETIRDHEVENWGINYPVICVVSMDQGEWVVMELGTHRYTAKSLPTRRFFIYGYMGNASWVYLGYQKEPFVEIRLPASVDPAVLSLTMDLSQIVQDRNFIADLHGLAPWDAAWLEKTISVSRRSLPANWQSLDDPAEYQAIQDKKEQWAKERSP